MSAFSHESQDPSSGLQIPAVDHSRFSLAVDRLAEHEQHEEVIELIEEATQLLNQLRESLESSRDIGAACGILMAQHRVSYEGAFARLHSISQRSHRKLRDVAADVVFTGEAPEGVDPRGVGRPKPPGGRAARRLEAAP
ncbi:MAG TPA: ANTAR domain-containing protein [Frankiaceae bacterium]|jgi:hypothetical protein|nr:ANTAR domain-containing protein [Frankiaceae bacterium]